MEKLPDLLPSGLGPSHLQVMCWHRGDISGTKFCSRSVTTVSPSKRDNRTWEIHCSPKPRLILLTASPSEGKKHLSKTHPEY